MITVFLVSKPGEPDTRLCLPQTDWSEAILTFLKSKGYTVSVCDNQTYEPDPRDDAELARVDALLNACP